MGSAVGPGGDLGRGAEPLPDQVDRDARQDDQEADPRGLGLEVDEVEHQQDRQADVDQRRDRVADRPVGPFSIGRLDPQDDHRADHQRVEGHVDRDDVFEELVVEVAVQATSPVAGSVVTVTGRARSAAQSPWATSATAGTWWRLVVPDALEEEAVAGHRVVDPGPGEDQAVDAAEGRDQDRRRHHVACRSGPGRPPSPRCRPFPKCCRRFVPDAKLNVDALFRNALCVRSMNRDFHTREAQFTSDRRSGVRESDREQ